MTESLPSGTNSEGATRLSTPLLTAAEIALRRIREIPPVTLDGMGDAETHTPELLDDGPGTNDTHPSSYSQVAARAALNGLEKPNQVVPSFNYAEGFRAANRDPRFIPSSDPDKKGKLKRGNAGQFTGKRYVNFKDTPPADLTVERQILPEQIPGKKPVVFDKDERPSNVWDKYLAMRANLRRDALNKRAMDINELELVWGKGIGDKKVTEEILEKGSYTFLQKYRLKQAGRIVRSRQRSINRIHGRLRSQAGLQKSLSSSKRWSKLKKSLKSSLSSHEE